MTATKTATHTPGPWTYGGTSAGTPTAIMHPDGRTQIALAMVCHGQLSAEIDTDEADANARLIAAAPAMRDALELIRSGAIVDIEEARGVADAALPLAEGAR